MSIMRERTAVTIIKQANRNLAASVPPPPSCRETSYQEFLDLAEKYFAKCDDVICHSEGRQFWLHAGRLRHDINKIPLLVSDSASVRVLVINPFYNARRTLCIYTLGEWEKNLLLCYVGTVENYKFNSDEKAVLTHIDKQFYFDRRCIGFDMKNEGHDEDFWGLDDESY